MRAQIYSLCLALITLSPSATLADEAKPVGKEALILAEHPLAESLWSTNGDRLSGIDALADAMGRADYVMLGERHDNPRHHEIQSQLIEMVAASGKSGAVIAEMIEPLHQPILDEINLAYGVIDKDQSDLKETMITDLGINLEWEKRGWFKWDIYRDVFATALDSNMSVHAGNPNRKTLMEIGRGGELGAEMLQNLDWDNDYTASERNDLLDELVGSHCGMMGREAMAPLVTLQRLKDAHMGRAMRQARKDEGVAILIAGNGHTRKDRGVGKYLPKDGVVSIAIMEVIRGENDPKSYPAFNPDLYDFVWFTARVDEVDQCEKFRAQLEAMKKKMSGKKHDHGKN